MSVNVDLRTLKAAFFTAITWNLVEKKLFREKAEEKVKAKVEGKVEVKVEEEVKVKVKVEAEVEEEVEEKAKVEVDEESAFNPEQKADFRSRFKNNSKFRRDFSQRRKVRKESEFQQEMFPLLSLRLRESIFEIGSSHIATKKFKQYVIKAGLDPRLRFHSLRHTFATWLVQERVSIYEVQKLLGHSSIAVTQIYSHLASDELHDAVSTISIQTNEMKQ